MADPREVWVEVRFEGRWLASARFVEREGAAILVELRIRSRQGDEITKALLRRVPLGELRRLARRELAGEDALPRGWAQAASRAPAHPGPRGRSDLFYAVWAARYARKLEQGSDAPVSELAEAHGKTYAAVVRWIHVARRRGLLTPTGKGRPGGRLTSKAKRLLRSEEKGG